jgi:hypothetical protein
MMKSKRGTGGARGPWRLLFVAAAFVSLLALAFWLGRATAPQGYSNPAEGHLRLGRHSKAGKGVCSVILGE